MRSRKSFPAIFAQTIEREISALEAAGSLWRPGRDRSGLERRSAGPRHNGLHCIQDNDWFSHFAKSPSPGWQTPLFSRGSQSTLALWAEFSIRVHL